MLYSQKIIKKVLSEMFFYSNDFFQRILMMGANFKFFKKKTLKRGQKKDNSDKI